MNNRHRDNRQACTNLVYWSWYDVWWFIMMYCWRVLGTVFELVLCCFHWCHLLLHLHSCLQTMLTLLHFVIYLLHSPACSHCSSLLHTSFSAKRSIEQDVICLCLLDYEVYLISCAVKLPSVMPSSAYNWADTVTATVTSHCKHFRQHLLADARL